MATLPIPNFADIAKSANDVVNKDFSHVSKYTWELKSTTPNNTSFKVSGKATHEGASSGAVEGKIVDKASGLTFTQTWNTAAALDSKLEFKDAFAKGLKLEGLYNYMPGTAARPFSQGAKANLHFQQPNFHARAFFDLLKGPTANLDVVVGDRGFLLGGAAGYDVNKAAVTSYATSLAYAHPQYTAAITATENLSVFGATFYQKVNSQVEVGCKAVWNQKTGNNLGLDLATKYRIDPASFVKAKINDRGTLAVAYKTLVRPGVEFAVGASVDTQKMDQAPPKVGVSFFFEG